jgi:hypothetical protein
LAGERKMKMERQEENKQQGRHANDATHGEACSHCSNRHGDKPSQWFLPCQPMNSTPRAFISGHFQFAPSHGLSRQRRHILHLTTRASSIR